MATADIVTTEPTVAVADVGEYPTLPRAQKVTRIVVGVLVAAAALYAPFYFTPARNELLSQALYIAVAAMGLNLLTGFNGQISIGHGAFFGVGAFTTGILMVDYDWTFESTLPVAALLSGVVGAVVGFPALRVRGLYLALVTLGLAVAFPQVADRYIKGVGGRAMMQPRPTEFGSLLDGLENDQWMYFVCLTTLVVVTVLAWNLIRSRTGRAMIACRDHELAAVTVGVSLPATKVGTFAVSAAYAGLAGSLSVMVHGFADATNPLVYFQRSIEFLIAMVIGGAATISGPIVGALLLVTIRRNAENWTEGETILAPALLGGALILVTYLMPDGVVGGLSRLRTALPRWYRWLRTRLARLFRRRRATDPDRSEVPTTDRQQTQGELQ